MRPELPLDDDRRARIEALDATRSFIVQAPAGSGKTELLIQRYLTLLATVEHPEEVLAITFTIKAAQEMQLRVLSALQQARTGDAPAETHQQVTFDAARAVLERDRQLDWRLLDSPRRMRIQTLDALNAGIARSLPFSSGLGGAARVVSDEELRALYRAAGAATLEWLLASGSGRESAAIEELLLHLDNNTGAFIAHVAGMLETRDQWLPIVGAGLADADGEDAVRKTLEGNIASHVAIHLQKIRALLPAQLAGELLRLGRHAAGNAEPNSRIARLYAAFDACNDLPPAPAERLDDWCGIAELLLTQKGTFRKSIGGSNGFPPGADGPKQEMLALLEAFAQHPQLAIELHKVRRLPAPQYTDEQWTVLLALFRLLPLAVTELRGLFGAQGVTDFTEVAIAADRALGSADEPGEMTLLLDYRLRHLLIDEMQDTSIAQYRLLEKLVAGWQPDDGRTLFCVGDPMQSIYRFRNAEVGQFLLARKTGIGELRLEPLLLRQNFRSSEGLVHWFNSVFEKALPAADDIAAGAISYATSVAHPGRGDSGASRVHPLFGASVSDEADYGRRLIEQCLASPDGQSVAVLVRSRTQLPLLLRKLREAGIDYQAIEIDRLTDLPEIIDLLALTRALCHRSDRIAWLGLLRGPCVGLTWLDLHMLVRNDRRRTVWELLHDEVRVAGLSPEARPRIRAFVKKLAPVLAGHGTASLRETVERAWYVLGGALLPENAEQVENVYRFLDVLERIESAGTLPDVAELEATLDQERVSSRTGHDGRLQIMTMHKAKGLEFDHVVLYGLGRRPRGNRKAVLSWLAFPDDSGNERLLISPVGPRAELESDSLHAWIEAAGREKDRFEQDRLLYVACTRARHSLHLLGHVALTADGDAFSDPPNDCLLSGIWQSVRPLYDAAFQSRSVEPAAPASSEHPRFMKPLLHRLSKGRALPPIPRLPVDDRKIDAVEEGEGRQVDYYWVGSTARHAGTIVHRWLKRITDGRLTLHPANVGDLLPQSRNWATELGVPGADVEAVCGRVARAMKQIADDERGRWLLSGGGHAELPLTGIWNGRIESIVIDRVRIADDGVHWIVDYKSSTHEGGDIKGFLQQEADRYRPQLAKYASLYRAMTDAPVRTALYFPLLKEFREVPIDDTAISG